MKSKISLYLLFFFLTLALSSCASFSNADRLYGQAREFAKEGRNDFAFLSLTELLRETPDYRFAAEAKFAIAEYYFLRGNYTKALRELADFLTSSPDNELAVLAKSFLYNIITDLKWVQGEAAEELVEQIKLQFFSNPVFFIFSEFKEKSITSLLGNNYLLKEYVDKIEIYKNGKLFFSVSL